LTCQLTLAEALSRARKSLERTGETPGLDGQMLLAETLNRDRAWILAHPEYRLDHAQQEFYNQALARCVAGEPLPYILGWWEFFGRRFQISKSVLIPRPETEHLVEAARRFLEANPDRRNALDVGTGCGCIAVSLSVEVPDLCLVATDISVQALHHASVNARLHHVEGRIHFIQTDLTTSLRGPFDLICANLPYIPTIVLHNLEVGRKEPSIALDGGEDGFDLIRRMLATLSSLLAVGGRAVMEIESSTGERILDMAKGLIADARLDILQDLSGLDRVLVIDR
jgi:release factor glutamine methyltransferase